MVMTKNLRNLITNRLILKSSAKVQHFESALSVSCSLLKRVPFISVFSVIYYSRGNVQTFTNEMNGIRRQEFGMVWHTHLTQLLPKWFEPFGQRACGDGCQTRQFGFGHRARRIGTRHVTKKVVFLLTSSIKNRKNRIYMRLQFRKLLVCESKHNIVLFNC